MNFSKIDEKLLNIIDVSTIEFYLTSNGWKLISSSEIYSVYRKQEYEIILPYDKSYSDYLLRFSEMMNLISECDEIDLNKFIEKMIYPEFDSLMFRVVPKNKDQFDLPINDGVKAINSIKDLLINAGNSILRGDNDKKQYPEITQFISNVKMGQTVKGSYVFKIYSRYVEPENVDDLLDEPFCRQVISKFHTSLNILNEFIINNNNLQNLSQNGINSSFCKSIIDLSGDDAENDIEIKIKPAIKKPFKHDLTKTHFFDKKSIPIIKDAADRLHKSESLWSDVFVTGYVVSLTKKSGELKSGSIVIRNVDKTVEYKNIKYNPTELENDLAIECYKDSSLITFQGDIEKTGKESYLLRNVSTFKKYIN